MNVTASSIHHRRLLQHTVVVATLTVIATGCDDNKNRGTPANASSREQHEDQHGKARSDAPRANHVRLSETARVTANIQTARVVRQPRSTPTRLEVPGQVEFDPRRVALVTPRLSGRLERLTVMEGDRVREGQTLAFIYSPTFVVAQHDYMLAARRSARLAGTDDAEGANALLHAARGRLRILGIPDEALERLARAREPEPFLPILAPFTGSIMHVDALTGSAVEAGDSIFKIADLSVVDVVAEVPERALPLVHVGQMATIEIAAYPGLRFDGRVERLRDELNPDTRTIQAVIHAPNSAGRLRPGMYASVQLAVAAAAVSGHADGKQADTLLTIPERAVVTDRDARILFVEIEPGLYERRTVEITSMTPPGSAVSSEQHVIVRRGVRLNELVVTHGAFTLKSELTKASLGEHGH